MIRFIEPDEMVSGYVDIAFNKSTGKLSIIDFDNYQEGLPTNEVTTKDYFPERRGNQSWNSFSWLYHYRTVEVKGEDKTPTKKE
ncbi:hypothetical protein MM239_01555 [Belliella sp. DSM 111904]|uniref:Uncharacterized protein n=1 Tax=Belliella filtrata TaxID=2923435 RepID=A0ABS9UVA4_9BACT|nr:hypothetical protein [Belliella filtrata]MCH7408066.1 hypothetical protein [Belliella filtrata]